MFSLVNNPVKLLLEKNPSQLCYDQKIRLANYTKNGESHRGMLYVVDRDEICGPLFLISSSIHERQLTDRIDTDIYTGLYPNFELTISDQEFNILFNSKVQINYDNIKSKMPNVIKKANDIIAERRKNGTIANNKR